MTADSEYICEREDLFDQLKNPQWFSRFVEYQFGVYFGYGPVAPIFSSYMMASASKRYVKDAGRVTENEFGGGKLDHFKTVGILVHWLRRLPPVSDFKRNPDYQLSGVRLRSWENRDLEHVNYEAAFDLGFRICRFWQSLRADSEKIYGRPVGPKDFTLEQHPALVADIAYVLAEKNVSPHALALIYRCLFTKIV